MKGRPYLKNIKELLSDSAKVDISRYEIAYFESMNESHSIKYAHPLYTDAYVYILVKTGNAQVMINYKTYTVFSGSIIVLTPIHIMQFSEVSFNFKYSFLIVNKPFMNIAPSTEKVFKHLNRSLKLFEHPVVNLTIKDSEMLFNSMEQIKIRIGQTDHLMQKEIIQNVFITFLLEWINCYEKYMRSNPSDIDLNRSQQILNSFISLLKKYFKEEHHVTFYSSRIHITPQHLTLIIKKLTGQTIADFIYEMLYSEARILLIRSDLSIQQIADELHFSDSSAFGKFFKRRSGMSPLTFRKE